VAFIGDEFASCAPALLKQEAGAMDVPGSFQNSKDVIPKIFLGIAVVGAVIFCGVIFYALFIYK